MRRCLVIGASCLLAVSPVREVHAQSDTTHLHAIRAVDFAPLIGLGAAAAIVSPADRWLAKTVRRPSWVRNGSGHSLAKAVSFVGGNAPSAISLGVWAYGSLNDDRTSHAVGRSASVSLLASTIVTGSLKVALGRARPYVSGDASPRDFKFGRGWRNDDYQSLPSGHASMAFAFAAAISQERARIKGRSAAFDAAAYSGAALVALSRMVLDKHWASDVLLGAGIGTTAGLLTVRLSH